mmetsp:Transcript_19770/g.32930  ORF Transcript_19770/g.32930 Transcript_19770/m.32930 type:complete len:110 (-) Transcript_19770:604-933(-)|eukprot:CAMPEP_0119330504 /NCGR_PEP_ID=MMETSP1333-20130426/78391_1 /TAXON_ID=418940 /ORGANISM="Scyphosphaera apsteinii, Strain RCC1455" /LENGTH=109 /DNA_ID=CAMNT_0007339899 /DNA_START=228 /DNA_END=557 /DNA_ORIENTATION=+
MLSAHGQTSVQWVTRSQIDFIAQYIKNHVKLTTNFALCHGMRSGRETEWFRAAIPTQQVWGTELSPIAAKTAPWTFPADFHEQRPEWVRAADFVYSNALDHSYNATLAV